MNSSITRPWVAKGRFSEREKPEQSVVREWTQTKPLRVSLGLGILAKRRAQAK